MCGHTPGGFFMTHDEDEEGRGREMSQLHHGDGFFASVPHTE